MTVKLVVGIALFLVGIVAAVMGIVRAERGASPASTIVIENTSKGLENLGDMVIPVIAGLSLAVGGLLIGLSMGNWKNPRTHLYPGDRVVDPEGYHKMKHV